MICYKIVRTVVIIFQLPLCITTQVEYIMAVEGESIVLQELTECYSNIKNTRVKTSQLILQLLAGQFIPCQMKLQ